MAVSILKKILKKIPKRNPNSEQTPDQGKKEKKRKNKKKLNPLWICLGVLLLAAAGGGICFFALRKGNNSRSWDGEAFYRELTEFDALLVKTESFEKPETLNRRLDRLERRALGVESHLSVLKRRRLLARQDPRFISAYQKAAQEAAEAIPFSEALAAIAVESLLLGEPSAVKETEAKLRTYGSRLSEAAFNPLALGLYILLGDMKDPVRAGAIPNKEVLFLPETLIAGTAAANLDLAVDLLLLQILQGDTSGVSAQMYPVIHNSALTAANPELLQLAAEFFYDFDSPLRAAELFSQFTDARSLARQADALWLSGHTAGARNLWTLLLSPISSQEDQTVSSDSSLAIKARSLYNLASTTENIAEKRTNLQNFLIQERKGYASYYTYGTIYYSRLLDTPQSIQVLESALTGYNLLLDIELLRRRSETWPTDKAIAETWLLVNRYSDDPRIYQWGCYFFDLQRRYDETALLMKEAGYKQISGPWADFHESLRLLREGQLEEAELKLEVLFPPNFIWQAPANRARILEIQHNPEAALDYYETAAALIKDKKAAAKILFRISLCLRTLGQEQESLHALEEALDFDPEYLNARLEMQRRESSPEY